MSGNTSETRCKHERKEYISGNTYCKDCKIWINAGHPPHYYPAAPVVSTAAPEPPTRNSEVLKSFVDYCRENPEFRFWQALRNWSGYRFILAADCSPATFTDDNRRDTFDWEGKRHDEKKPAMAPESYKPAEGPEHKHYGFPLHITREGKGIWDKSCPQCASALDPAATPVTVEAPEDAPCEGCGATSNHWIHIGEYHPPYHKFRAATPKPIGDAEAVAAEIWRFVHAHYRAEITKQEIAAILSPLFAPAGPENKEQK